MRIITLTTDFGTRDGFVGAMKGVIARLAPDARVVDLAHDVPRHDIAHAAWVVATACGEFPHGTIHVVVVDPGVGGDRADVVVKTGGHLYVGPDNGVFAYVANEISEAWAIQLPRFVARTVSATFHGRDVFAVAAAKLALGEAPNLAGPMVQLAGRLPWGPRQVGAGRVVHVDRFGNLISDLPAAEAGPAIAIAERTLPVVDTYEAVPVGELLAYPGSAGTIEIAVREGDACAQLGVHRGALVRPAVDGASPYR